MRYGSIQALRAIAANMVVLCHLIGLQSRLYPPFKDFTDVAEHLGSGGVGCFFVISGFVITKAAAREDWRSFLIARLSRIFPIYWFYLALTLLFMLTWQQQVVSPGQILPALLLLPIGPQIVPVAWTLVLEVYFYSVMAVAIVTRIGLGWALTIWGGACLASHTMAPGSLFGNLMTLEFIAGGLIAVLHNNAVDRALAIPTPHWLRLLGDASYSIYLCHFLVIAGLGRLLFVALPGSGLLASVICLAAANIVGLISYAWLEKPALKYARALAPRGRPGPDALARPLHKAQRQSNKM